jgi:hypothetical protein
MSAALLPRVGTLTLPEYQAYERAGAITRPITLGPMRRARLHVGWAPDTPVRSISAEERRQEALCALRRRCKALACAGS